MDPVDVVHSGHVAVAVAAAVATAVAVAVATGYTVRVRVIIAVEGVMHPRQGNVTENKGKQQQGRWCTQVALYGSCLTER